MDTPSSETHAWTVARLLAWTRDFLARCKIESPRLCAELLLAHAMRCDRIKLYTRHDAEPDEPTRTAFRSLVKEASAGRPIAYLLGRKEFFSLSFDVTPDVLIPRPESEILVERAIERGRRLPSNEPFHVLDLCTGSGCIAVSVAKHLPAARVVATDISAAAIEVARRNAARHGVDDRIEFRVGDLYAALETPQPVTASPPFDSSHRLVSDDRSRLGPFDLILCNPPYIADSDRDSLPRNVRDFEPHSALFAGRDGLDIIRRVIPGAAGHLKPAGRLVLEMAYNQSTAVLALFDPALWISSAAIRDGGGHDRVAFAVRRTDDT